MSAKLFCLLMVFSATAFAQNATESDQEWEGASNQIEESRLLNEQHHLNQNVNLELSNPWYYGRQDSDTIVNRDRHDTHHD
jgi:hypothetical protein